ncbi:MAG: hypothetical protein JWM19_887 [Actinomycetia bacterium]|nr:hypothetical protein [Actinomycetes bacterium]
MSNPFAADPDYPTDDELAAAIQRGLDRGDLITAEDFLAQVRAQED